MEMINEMELSPKEYFERIKDKKNTITSEQLEKVYENCLELKTAWNWQTNITQLGRFVV